MPDTKHADSQLFAPYIRLIGNTHSAFTYLLLLLEGMFIVGSFSYLGAYIAKTYHFNYFFGQYLWGLLFGVGILGLGFIFTHSILLARATGFAMKARGSAMSLVAFCFMGGGGIGTAIGGKIAAVYGLPAVFLVYGLALAVTLGLSFGLISGPVMPQPQSPRPEASLNS